jgi:hypothetical protein
VIVLTMALSCYCAGSVPAPRPEKGRSHGAAALDTVGIPPTATKTGCAAFDIRLGGPRGVTVTPVAGDACGTVQLTVVGTAIFDSALGVLELPLALRNIGIVQLHPPVAVLARPGSLAVTAGTPVGGALRYVRVDSLAGDSMRTGRPDARWVFDRSLGAPQVPEVLASDGVAVIPAAGTSGARFIGVTVPHGVTALRVTLYGSGATVFTVPAQAPDHVPLEEVEDSRLPGNIVTNDPRIPGRVVRNKLWLLFRDGATPEQRQAAIDVVQGVVIGGRRIGPSPYYYLRIPANPDSAGAPLAAAIRTLAVLPQVQHVMPDLVTGPTVPR